MEHGTRKPTFRSQGAAGDTAGHWLEQGLTEQMAQNQEILAHLERLARQMESMLAGQQKLEQAVRGLHTSKASQSSEAAPLGLPLRRQRSHGSEPSNQSPVHERFLHEKPPPSEPNDGDPALSQSSSSRPLPMDISGTALTSEFGSNVTHLQQRMLVPCECSAASDEKHPESEALMLEGGPPVLLDKTPGGFDDPGGRRCWQKPMNPDSNRRTTIDIISCVVLLYDCIVIPLQVGWDLPLEGALLVGYAVTLSFWTTDFLLGFATSFYRGGDLVMDYRAIAIHYLRHDFVLNFVIVCADWVVIIIQLAIPEASRSETQFARALRLLKVYRILHLVRVLKNGTIAKVYDMMTRICFKHGLAEQFQGFTKIGTIFFFILWINHLGSCFWHGVGASAYREYVKSNQIQTDSAFDYLLMFYWSVSAITAGETIMIPTNTAELVTTISFILCGLILVSILVSNLAASLLDLRLANQERNASLFKLRQYFYQNKVKGEAAMPIQTKISERLSAVKRLTDKDIWVLELVPPAMRNLLRTEVYGPKLQSHFFIRACSSLSGADRSVLMDFCCTAMANEVLAPGRVVFHDKEEAKGAYYLNWGACEYVLGGLGNRSRTVRVGKSLRLAKTSRTRFRSVVSDGSTSGEPVEEGAWISDVALWVLWRHCGLLEVSKTSEMCIVSVDAFVKVTKLNPHLECITKDYSNAMYAAIQRESASDIGDLSVGVDNESILNVMPLRSRVRISMGAFNTLLSQHFLFPAVKAKRKLLYEEVQAGKCDLIIDIDQEVLRVVNVVALRVLRHDKKMLAQIAEITQDGTVEPAVNMPGVKVKAGELPHDALQRLRSTILSELSGGIIVGNREVNVEEKTSKAYGVKTKYMRSIYHANWDAQFTHVRLPEVAENQSHSSLDVLRGVGGKSRSSKFKDWFSLKPFVVGGSGSTRRILLWVLPEDFGVMLADEDYIKDWVACFDVPAGRVPVPDGEDDHDV